MRAGASPLRCLSSLLQRAAAQHAERTALQRATRAGGEGVSFTELDDQASRGAAVLRARGLGPGQRVILHLDAQPSWGAAFFAIARAGGVVVPVIPATPPRTLATVARHAQARVLVCDGSTRSASEALEALDRLHVEDLIQGRDAAPSAGSRDAGHTTRPDDTAIIAFTSGSTQAPKAVELSHQNVLSDVTALVAARRAKPADAFLSMLPPAHMFELVAGLLGPLACGARVVYPGAPLPNRLVDALRDDGITHAMAVPALLGALYAEILEAVIEAGVVVPERRGQTLQEAARRFRDVLTDQEMEAVRAGVRERLGRTFRSIIVGGAALDPSWAGVLTPLDIGLEVGYGLTEAGPVVSLGLVRDCPAGSVGRPLPGVEVRIGVDDEILVRGPNVMRGYLDDPEATREALHDGWLRTGDRGRLDPQGHLFVTGRLKEAIVTAAGETLQPEEVEAYYVHPAFAEMCVAAVPGPGGNDEAVLFVLRQPGGKADVDAVFADLRAAAPARCRVARMQLLEGPLPRTPTGKVMRARLAARTPRDGSGGHE